MTKYRAFITVDANIYVNFELPDGSSTKDIQDVAMDNADAPSLCWHCSNDLELGGLLEVHEVFDLDAGKTVYEKP